MINLTSFTLFLPFAFFAFATAFPFPLAFERDVSSANRDISESESTSINSWSLAGIVVGLLEWGEVRSYVLSTLVTCFIKLGGSTRPTPTMDPECWDSKPKRLDLFLSLLS